MQQLGRYNLFIMHILASSVFGQSSYQMILDWIKHCCKVIPEECCDQLNVKEQPSKSILLMKRCLKMNKIQQNCRGNEDNLCYESCRRLDQEDGTRLTVGTHGDIIWRRQLDWVRPCVWSVHGWGTYDSSEASIWYSTEILTLVRWPCRHSISRSGHGGPDAVRHHDQLGIRKPTDTGVGCVLKQFS